MKRLFLALIIYALPCLAQPVPAPVQKIIMLKYAEPNAVQRLLQVFNLSMQTDSRMKVISISGLPDRVSAAEAAIKALDVPSAQQKDIELTVYFIVGSDKENLTGNAVPQDLQSVISQLKSAFAFKNYRMLDALTLRTRSGADASTSGVLNSGPGAPATSEFKIHAATVTEDGATIRIDGLHAALRMPFTVTKGVQAAARGGSFSGAAERQVQYAQSGIDQDIDVKEGQKVVVGRTSLEGPDKPLFLVLMAHAL